MAEQRIQTYTRKNDDISGKSYPISASKRSTASNSDTYNPDELILTLSQSYENRRAVQVFEWEATRVGGTFRRKPII